MNLSVFYTIALLTISNIFMTFAWYGHLKLKEYSWFASLPLFGVILISWGIAFFEYCFQVPANRIGFQENGGPFSLIQLKVIQEVITLTVFVLFSTIFFRSESLRWNHLLAFVFLIAAVYLVFKK
ncbi:MAG: DMT family protein [Dysgonamonadaceae bacterium]